MSKQTDIFNQCKTLPYSILPNIPRSVGIPVRLWDLLKFGFYYRSVGMTSGLEELIKLGKFESPRGKGLKFTYTEEEEKFKELFYSLELPIKANEEILKAGILISAENVEIKCKTEHNHTGNPVAYFKQPITPIAEESKQEIITWLEKNIKASKNCDELILVLKSALDKINALPKN